MGDPVPRIATNGFPMKRMVLRRPRHGTHHIFPIISFPVFCAVLRKVVEAIVVEFHRRDNSLFQFGVGGVRMRVSAGRRSARSVRSRARI
jgi:hypothetical protein